MTAEAWRFHVWRQNQVCARCGNSRQDVEDGLASMYCEPKPASPEETAAADRWWLQVFKDNDE